MAAFVKGIRARIIKIPLVGALGLSIVTSLAVFVVFYLTSILHTALTVRLHSAIYWSAIIQRVMGIEYHLKKSIQNPNDPIRLKENLLEFRKHAKVAKDSVKEFEVLKPLFTPKQEAIYKEFPQKFNNLMTKYEDLAVSMEKATMPISQTLVAQWYQNFIGPISDDFNEVNDVFEDMTNARIELLPQVVKEVQSSETTFFTLFAVAIVFSFIMVLGAGMWIGESLVKKLMGISENLADSSQQMSNTSGVLSQTSQQVSTGASEGAASLEESVSSIEEFSSMVKQNADHAKEANALSLTARGAAESGEGEIHTLLQAMDEISDSSRKIEEIIAVIDNIAFQTNLLALNAAVEAARAGEQGKGFAVVAEAVRNLAQRSSTAAKDINVLIKESVDKSQRGVTLAKKCGENLKDIVNHAKRVSDLIGEIASASQEQAHGVAQISKAMNHLDQVTQTNAAAAEESAAASEEMATQAEVLDTLVHELNEVIAGSNSENSKSGSSKNPPPRSVSSKKMSMARTPTQRSVVKTSSGKRGAMGTSGVSKASSGSSGAAHLIPFDSDEQDGEFHDQKLPNASQF